MGIVGPVFGACASSPSPRPENKQSKRQHSTSAEGKNKKAKSVSTKTAANTMVIDDDGKASDDWDSLHRRRRPSSAQQNAQSIELILPTEDDAPALWREYEMVKDVNSRFRVLVSAFDTVRLGNMSLPSSVDEQPSTSTAFSAAACQLTMPLTSSLSSPTLSSPPATTSSVTAVREKDVLLPESPVHGNLGHNYFVPFEDPQRRRSVNLWVSIGCHLLSRLV
uniref:Uncharacterized protein n=1 Tax=Nicotiana tabacum TaxID=4097 RepID=A0A1S3Z372_TOBAC|nr:PREDICTED: uncharacterized protein LOC107782507 [Nicotiana tabacum]XP_016458885.1 PREDICTED: uncharacterized protein LOC107782507 [Nicotiana tabacum]